MASPYHISRLPLDSAQLRYERVVKALAGGRGVTAEAGGRKGFGSSGQLKADNRIFAMLVRGALVVKLPRARVDQLIASKDGMRFDPRRDGRVMKEWVTVAAASKLDWLALAREALAFVRAASR